MTAVAIRSFKDLNIPEVKTQGLEGPKIDINRLFGREIIVHSFTVEQSKIKG